MSTNTSHQKKLKQPISVFPDTPVDRHMIVGLGFSEFSSTGQMAVFLIFRDGRGMRLAVNLPGESERLKEGEFFLKDWAENTHIVDRLISHDVLEVMGYPRIESGHVKVSTAKINPDVLSDFSDDELSRFHP